ncbi:purine and uridine phosphorylase [Lepidopterella palustris CBS 459.81]|uniref:Purine and uridine phosphorylase n=1 Tax=Lepidopterella palustris CBS 459.81 TaxID=1314670 RepID=A0A8E2E9L4_9PEZI|nr:purine and uridine phosphorylase [Lepidopterella palustris CBS 459.81]
MKRRGLQAEDYTVGWICALPIELAAAREMLDEEDDELPQYSSDSDLYTFGRIGDHNVILACLPAGQMGPQSAATVAARMTSKFTSIRFGLMVGIGGGVPSSESDIRLGDVVISQPSLQYGGVVQYDFGKTEAGGRKSRTGWLDAPPKVLLNAVSKLRALHYQGRGSLTTYLSAFDRLENFRRDAAYPDVLFKASYNHIRGSTCEQCSKEEEVKRTPRKDGQVVVHYGTIASGNQVIKDGITRDRISTELGGVMCFEMEAAGLMNDFRCLVIRGICDYADSHKNKKWQPYAAATAAACAKEIMSVIPAAVYDACRGQKRPETPPRPCSTVPFRRDLDFVSHGTLLNQIHGKLSSPASRVALVGLGGVGKSQLAIEYCHRAREQFPQTWVFWVHSSNLARLEQGYQDIADTVKIPGRKDHKADIFQLVRSWLRDESKGKWILVLDNADDDTMVSKISAYLPQSQNGLVLVTTRNRSVASRLVEESEIIPVKPMDEDDAIILLKKKFGTESNSAELAELAAALECMPLAIVQAAAYIKQRAPRYSLQQYLKEFNKSDKRKTSLLDHEAGYLRRDPEANNSILVTWQISFDHIRDTRRSAADLLSLMSFFDRQSIPKALLRSESKDIEECKDRSNAGEGELEDLGSGKEDTSSESIFDEFEDDIYLLRNYSLVSIKADGISLEMHGLVQLATRRWLEVHGEIEKWKQQFIHNLFIVYPTGEPENWTKCQVLFPHAKSAETQRPSDDGTVQDWGVILRNAAWYAWAKGDYNEAERMSSKARKALLKVVGKENTETLKCMEMLGTVYRYKGRWKEAEELEVQVMETRKRVLGPEHPDTLTSMANLASTSRVLGPEHPSTLTSMANLASTYRNQGRWKEAEGLEVQVMETRKMVLGPEHPSTLTSMSNLAHTWKSQSRNEDAISLMRKCCQLLKQILGPQHSHTIASLEILNEWQIENMEAGI